MFVIAESFRGALWRVSRRPYNVGGPLAIAEVVAFLLAAPMLVFPNRYSPIALAMLPALWLVRVIARRQTLRRSAADWPLLGLMLMTSVSLYPSVDLALSRPKLYGLVLGFYVFGLLIEHLRSSTWRLLLAGGLVSSGLAVSGIGLVGTNWTIGKLAFLGSIYDRLPRMIAVVQTSFGPMQGGIHPNEVGGTLALLMPVPLALLLFSQGWRWRVALALAILPMLGVLALTVSRAAFVGVAVAGLTLAVLRWPRVAMAVPLLALMTAGVIWRIGIGPATDWLLATTEATGSTWESRLEIWSRAYYMIEDFFFTGIGLNTFPTIARLLYPFFLHHPDVHMPHAHNMFLQVAVDLGVPGLVSFLGLLIACSASLVVAWRRSTAWQRGLVAGLGCGLLAHLVFGLTDAITLGAKPGVLLWAMLGGALALGLESQANLSSDRFGEKAPHTRDMSGTNSRPAPGDVGVQPRRHIAAERSNYSSLCEEAPAERAGDSLFQEESAFPRKSCTLHDEEATAQRVRRSLPHEETTAERAGRSLSPWERVRVRAVSHRPSARPDRNTYPDDPSTKKPGTTDASAPGAGPLQWVHWALFALASGLGVYITITGIQMFP